MAKRRAKRPLSTPSRFDGEALGLVLFALGIFLAITVLLPPSGTGFMARAATFLSDWTGWGRFLLPVLPLCYGALVFLGRDLRNLHRRALGGAIMALSLLALHAVFELDRTPGEAGQLAHLVMTPLHSALSVLAAVLPILTLSLGAEIVLALPAFTLAKGFVRIVSVAALGLFGLGRDAALARKDGRERIRVRNTLRSELQGHVRDLGGLEALYPESKELASWKRETRDALRGLHTLDEDGLAALGKDLAAWRELARNFTLTAGRDLVAAVAAEAPDVAVSVEETAQDVRKGRTELSRELPATSASAALERVRRVLNMDLMRLAARAAALERDRARAEKALAKPDPSVLARELPRHRARTKDWATFVTSAYEWRERAMTYPGWPDLAERYDRASAALASALAQALSEEPDTTLRDLGLWTARLDAAPATPDAPRETGGTPLFAPPAASPQPQNDPAGVVASGESVDTARGTVPPMFDLDFGFTGDLGEAGESDTPDAQPGGPVSAPPEATPQVYDLPSTALSEPERLVFTPATLPEPTFRSPYPSAQTPPWEDEAQPPAPASVSGDRTFGESDFGDEDGFEEADDPFRPNRAAASVPSPAPVVTTRVRTPLTAAPARSEAARSEAPRAEPVQPNFDAAQQQGAIDIAVPTLAMLDPIPAAAANLAALDLMARTRADLINQTLAHFNLQARVVDFARGPTVTRYEIEPAPGEKISRIASLSNDLARALAVGGVRVEAPVPGKSVIGLEVPNAEREPITFHAAVAHPAFAASRAKLPIILGKSIDGEMMVGDLAKMPHLLVAGSTGSGKSVCVNTLVASLLYRYLPTELRFVMIDPKMVELTPYDGIPHLVRSVVTNPADAAGVLLGAVAHMERRYKMLSQVGAKNLEQFNAKMRQIGEPELPHLVIIIDELADLMITAPKEVESAIMRLAQMARATGMHLVLATQRPSVDILTSLIKVNVPARIAFAVSSSHDSRTILDAVGAERLTGMGDMLFYQPGLVKPMRLQGPYISETESVRITDYLRRQVFEDWFGELYGADFEGGLMSTDGPKAGGKDVDFSDPFLRQAAEICIEEGQGSVSRLQRRLSVGHARAGKLMDMLEAMGVVSKHQGSKPRDVLITRDDLPEYFGR